MRILRLTWLKIKLLCRGPLLTVVLVCLLAAGFLMVHAITSQEREPILAVCVVDRDGSEASARLCRQLDAMTAVQIHSSHEEEATALLTRGEVEGILYLEAGLEEHLAMEGDLPIVYRGGPGSQAGSALLEIVYGELHEMRAWARAAARCAEIPGYQERLTRLMEEYEDIGGELLQVQVKENQAFAAAKSWIILGGFASAEGILAMFLFLGICALGSGLSHPQVVKAEERGGTIHHAWLLSYLADGAALVSIGVGMAAIWWMIHGVLGGMGMLCTLAYIGCISAISLWLGGLLTTGRLELLVPMLTLLLGILGGSFFDPAILSQQWRWVSYVTPQGWYLHGVKSAAWEAAAVLSFLAVVFFVMGGARRRRRIGLSH